jgi:hypothetical protein
MNPYFVYIFGFSVAILLYQLKWAAIYPDLSLDLFIFIFFTLLISFAIGSVTTEKINIRYFKLCYNSNISMITAFNYFSWSLVFAYAGEIPLLGVMTGDKYDYSQFSGIPFYFGFVMSFQGFFCTYLFHMFISTKMKNVLILYLLNIVPYILFFGRGLILIVLVSTTFIYISSRLTDNSSIKSFSTLILKIFTFFFAILFLFGIAGDMRSVSQVGNNTGSDLIENVGSPTSSFRNTGLPKEMFWGYLYASSPLANLQKNIQMDRYSDINTKNITNFIVNEIVPDYISSGIKKRFDLDNDFPIPLITPALNVTTIYAPSFYHLSWVGLLLMFTFIMILPILYLNLLGRDNPLAICGIATISTMYLFNTFANMIVFSGISFQLIYPLIFRKILNARISNDN